MKIGPVDTEIALLIFKKRKKEEINASKIYSPVGRFAERAKNKLKQAKHIALFGKLVERAK